jgi:hypothetical protein
MKSFQALLTILSLACGFVATNTADADVVFAVNSTTAANADRIVRISPDGSNPRILWSSTNVPDTPRGVGYDAATDRVYWSDAVSRNISSVSASDGSGLQTFNRNNGSTNSLAVDGSAGKLYVYEAGNPTTNEAITQMNVNGSGATAFFPNAALSANSWLTLDSAYLYFSDNTDIVRRSLDGLTTQTVVAGAGNGVRGLAVLNDDIFWLNNTTDSISKRSISNNTAMITTSSLGAGSTPQGLAVDGQFLFYAEQGNIASRGINRLNTDFTGSTTVFALSSSEIANGITAVPEPSSAFVLASLALAAGRYGRRRLKNRPATAATA